MKIWKWILELFFPNRCVFCGKLSRTAVCEECKKKIVYITEPRCKQCGKPVRYAEQEFCYDCSKTKFHYVQGRSLWLHKPPVTWSIYQFKFHNRRIHAEFYAKEFVRMYGNWVREWEINRIIPVPLHKKRRRKRGYNQAEILAKHIGKQLDIPVDTSTVIRIRATRPQKELDHKERQRNLKGAFQVTRKLPKGERVLLIDDIYTTGSTIDTIAQKLCENSDVKVWFFTISIGQDF